MGGCVSCQQRGIDQPYILESYPKRNISHMTLHRQALSGYRLGKKGAVISAYHGHIRALYYYRNL